MHKNQIIIDHLNSLFENTCKAIHWEGKIYCSTKDFTPEEIEECGFVVIENLEEDHDFFKDYISDLLESQELHEDGVILQQKMLLQSLPESKKENVSVKKRI